MTNPRSSLASFAPLCREADDANARKAARDAWHKSGIILLNPVWFQHWPDRTQAELLAVKLFGKRKAG